MSVDVEKYRRPTGGKPQTTEPGRLPRHRPGEWFLKGPIPGVWLGRAAALPGKALHVALAVWHEASLTKQRRVKLTRKTLFRFGAGQRHTAYDGLKRLQQAGLIDVERGNGRRPCVEILEVAEDK